MNIGLSSPGAAVFENGESLVLSELEFFKGDVVDLPASLKDWRFFFSLELKYSDCGGTN